MHPTITLGRVAGIRVSINWSWAIVFALIVWTLAATVFPSQNPHLAKGTYVAMGTAAALIFFLSILLHELGHALQARREGVEIEGITLWLFGGVARFRGMFPSAGAELRIALAGPLVSALLGGAFVGVAAALPGGPVEGVAAWLGYINLILLVFNMLPALPLDGGRVLRALLWRRGGDFSRATRIAADVGRAFGYGLIGLGLVLFITQGAWSGAWFAFIGWFLLGAAAAEGRYALLRDALGDLVVRDLMIRQPVAVPAGSTLAEFMDAVVPAHRFTTYPVTEGGRVVGLLPFASVARVPRREWDATRVSDCTVPLDRALVLDDGHVVGLLSITDVGRLLAAGRGT